MKLGVPVTVGGPDPELTDVASVAKAQLRKLQASIKQALPMVTDEMSKAHLQDLEERIEEVFEN